MGNNQFEEKPSNVEYKINLYSGSTEQYLQFDGNTIEWVDAKSTFIKGIIIKSEEKFFMRLWLSLSNPFRYIFTGKIRY